MSGWFRVCIIEVCGVFSVKIKKIQVRVLNDGITLESLVVFNKVKNNFIILVSQAPEKVSII